MRCVPYFLRLLSCAVAIPPLFVNGQVTVSAQLPPGGMVQKEQLWNLVIVNNTRDFAEINIKLTLQDALSGQVVMSANTGSLLLSKGVKVITNADMQPVTYNYFTADFSGNFLPMGAYLACYGIYYTRGEAEESLSDECIKFTIDPLSPPLLNTPFNQDTVQTSYPLFTWMPPTPVNMFSNLNYDVIIAEVPDGQSPSESIENNTPIYTTNNLTQPMVTYPPGFTKLETGKTYAWQVIAKNSFSYAAKTDVWTFIVDERPEPPTTPATNTYLLLENDLKDTYIITNRQLHIKYTSFDIEHKAAILFSDTQGNKVFIVKQKIFQGDNYFIIDLNNRFQKDVIYNATITDMPGKKRAIQFRIK